MFSKHIKANARTRRSIAPTAPAQSPEQAIERRRDRDIARLYTPRIWL